MGRLNGRYGNEHKSWDRRTPEDVFPWRSRTPQHDRSHNFRKLFGTIGGDAPKRTLICCQRRLQVGPYLSRSITWVLMSVKSGPSSTHCAPIIHISKLQYCQREFIKWPVMGGCVWRRCWWWWWWWKGGGGGVFKPTRRWSVCKVQTSLAVLLVKRNEHSGSCGYHIFPLKCNQSGSPVDSWQAGSHNVQCVCMCVCLCVCLCVCPRGCVPVCVCVLL